MGKLSLNEAGLDTHRASYCTCRMCKYRHDQGNPFLPSSCSVRGAGMGDEKQTNCSDAMGKPQHRDVHKCKVGLILEELRR